MIFAIVGPSGAGKDTLIAGAMAQRPDLRLVRRVITRPETAGGEDFEGVTEAEFATRRAAGEFAVYWRAHGLHYGIPRAQTLGPNLGQGPILFNGSRAALPSAKLAFPDLQVILVTAPDSVLAARLAQRGRESLDDITARLARASFALPQGISATTVVNDSTPAIGIVRLLAALQPVNA
ncbi:MAG: phosphonate metabolism protein/1,5-bisphosphokinase (PRPP-forming) PhnN [Microgenomates group bacterium]